MYATTAASLWHHASRSASPRPLRARCTTVTCDSSATSRSAIRAVASDDALSTIVIRHEKGKPFER